jgi:hypothetical protein
MPSSFSMGSVVFNTVIESKEYQDQISRVSRAADKLSRAQQELESEVRKLKQITFTITTKSNESK